MAASLSQRPIEIAAFLSQEGWESAVMEPFKGDFSPRRYARLTKTNGASAILMDADPTQRTMQFVSIAKLLKNARLPAPDIYAAEPGQGLALLEDFGYQNVGALIDAGKDRRDFFMKAAEILATLHHKLDLADIAAADLPLFSPATFTSQAELFLDQYIPYLKQRPASDIEREDFRAALQTVLRPLERMPQSLMLRDFMPDNLMALPDGTLGLLDFQDGGLGPIAYDLASLCEEVRRDGGFSLLGDVLTHYQTIAQNSVAYADLMRFCLTLSAQRHLRILGIITQLAIRHGREDKLKYVPRIKKHLAKVLASPHLSPMKEFMDHFEDVG